MDGTLPSISPPDLASRIGTAAAPIVIDIRSPTDVVASDRLPAGAIHRPHGDAERLRQELPPNRPVVICDATGSESGRTMADGLRRIGVNASFLAEGFAGWQDRGLPTRRNAGTPLDKWVTREHPKIDRIACPWLISRFVNPLGEFIYVPPNDVLTVARERGAIPYDIKGVEFGHV